jgi:hypothetical protein
MLKRIAAATVVAAGLLVTTTPASAAPPGAPSWSVTHETASAAGHRWIESGSGIQSFLVLDGKLTNTGTGCYSVWTQFSFDLFGDIPRKRTEICGAGTVTVALRQSHQFTTTGRVTVCRGTASTANCAPWQSITSVPVRTPA